MNTQIVLYIILSGIVALLLALFQYVNKKKSISKLDILFSFLRFLTIFSILLLLINPKIKQETLIIEKPKLVVAVDNSSSISHLNQDRKAKTLIESLQNHKALNNKFDLDFFTFGETFKTKDSLTFSEKQTNIDKAFKQLAQIYKQTNAPTLIITDGNQTYGYDYDNAYLNHKQDIYPVILGDTVTYADLKIAQLNVNRYAYLKNKFPIEIILTYNGSKRVNSKLVVTKGSTTVYSKAVNFTKTQNSKVINFTLPALRVGVNSFKATLEPVKNEKNIINNSKSFAVEVIDQKTNIAIVSDFLHPDIGALKKSIERNEQRKVTLLNPKEAFSQFDDFQLFILYQPNIKFDKCFELLKKENKNMFVVSGPKTDLNFLNNANKSYQHELTGQFEEYQAEQNTGYIPFIVDDIDFSIFPPLKSNYGSVNFSTPFQAILNKTVNGLSLGEPLLATLEKDGRREGVLFGENIWKWRAQSFIAEKSFHQFDNFIGKVIQYLTTDKKKSRLNIEYESFYNGSSNIIVKAQFFDKNYTFDDRETLYMTVKNIVSNEENVYPLVLKNNNYQIDLSNLPPSKYNFTVRASNENISKSGSFEILEYHVEQQFLNANVTKLQKLATNSTGKSYFIDDTNDLINDLLNNNQYVSIQKSNKKSLPLIDWKYLLAIIVLCLSIEWFLRKYNGLI